MKLRTILLICGVALLLCANHADYLYQANLFKWWTWLPLVKTGAKWGLWDFIPHDSWHLVQFVRNTAGVLGLSLLGSYGRTISFTGKLWVAMFVLPAAAALVGYALTRAVGFTLILELAH